MGWSPVTAALLSALSGDTGSPSPQLQRGESEMCLWRAPPAFQFLSLGIDRAERGEEAGQTKEEKKQSAF